MRRVLGRTRLSFRAAGLLCLGIWFAACRRDRSGELPTETHRQESESPSSIPSSETFESPLSQPNASPTRNAPTPPIKRAKRFFDCSHFKKGEDGLGPLESRYGLERMHIINAGKAFDVYEARKRGEGDAAEERMRSGRLPTRERVEELARATPSPFIWDLEGAGWSQNPERWATVTRWAREAAPSKAQGHYGAFPVRAFHETPEEIDAANRKLGEVVAAVDFFVPSFYRFYDKSHDQRRSWKYMVLQAEAAVARYGDGKPAYPMMLEYYHPRAHEKFALKEIPEPQLEEMFRFVLDRFDGFCLWGGRNPPPGVPTVYRSRGFEEEGPVDWDEANMDDSPLGRVLARVLPEYRATPSE